MTAIPPVPDLQREYRAALERHGYEADPAQLHAVAKLDDEVHHFVEVVEEGKHFREIPPRAYAHLREEAGELHRAVRAMMRELD